MPLGDGTGPRGKGPGTGRGMGRRSGNPQGGMGIGQGSGMGQGTGQGGGGGRRSFSVNWSPPEKDTSKKEEGYFVPKEGEKHWALRAGVFGVTAEEYEWKNDKSDNFSLHEGEVFRTKEECEAGATVVARTINNVAITLKKATEDTESELEENGA